MLNHSQQKAVEAFRSGKNIFITGGAGTGKSYLLRYLQENFDIEVAATTGIAAVNVGGITIHSLACLNPFKSVKWRAALLEHLGRADRIRNLKALAIDEISMLDGRFLTQLDETLKHVRDQKRLPFGGVQIVAIGDFFQLAPVPGFFAGSKEKSFQYAFESPLWNSFETINLTVSERAKDPLFIEVLRFLRQGQKHPRFFPLMQPCVKPIEQATEKTIHLYPTFARCNKHNAQRFDSLGSGKEVVYVAKSGFTSDTSADVNNERAKELKELIKSTRTEEVMSLKVGTRVMLVKNLDVEEGLVNGSLGHVVGFETGICPVLRETNHFPIVEFDNGKCRTITSNAWGGQDKENKISTAWYVQVPLMKAWAITIHKSQGLTLDDVYFHAGGCFADGQYYVGVSRLSTLQGLKMPYLAVNWIKADQKVHEFYKRTVK